MKCFAVLAAFAGLAAAQTGVASTGIPPPYPGGNSTVPVGTVPATGTGTIGPTGTGGVSPSTPVSPIYTGAAAQVGGSLLAVVAAGVAVLA